MLQGPLDSFGFEIHACNKCNTIRNQPQVRQLNPKINCMISGHKRASGFLSKTCDCMISGHKRASGFLSKTCDVLPAVAFSCVCRSIGSCWVKGQNVLFTCGRHMGGADIYLLIQPASSRKGASSGLQS